MRFHSVICSPRLGRIGVLAVSAIAALASGMAAAAPGPVDVSSAMVEDEVLLRLTLQVHAAATVFLAGLIWFVQIVHYPLLRAVGHDHFAQYEQLHVQRTTWVVLPSMLIEALTVALLAAMPLLPWEVEPPGRVLALVGAGLLVIIWMSTFLIQAPCHHRLQTGGFDQRVWTRLVQTNWLRTVAWTARAWIALHLLASAPTPLATN